MRAIPALLAVLVCAVAFADSRDLDTQETIDFPAFLRESTEAMALRRSRLVDIERFNAMATEPGTTILDTRSREAFDRRHLSGAVHLNLADMTEQTLAQLLGPKDRRVLIYCNNNFLNDPEAFARKSAPAALNIPTFATLFIYDYRNVFELGSLLDVGDPRLTFEGSAAD